MNVCKLTKAFQFAAQKHCHQRRKGVNAEPYVNHLIEVADLLAQHTGGGDIDLICAGVLHDVLEDTETTYIELKREFGKRVADIVRECSDDKSLSQAERKHLEAANAGHKSPEARMVKMADKTSNLHSVMNSPPADWDDVRKKEYFVWTKSIIDNCRDVNAGLETAFDTAYQKGISGFSFAA